LGAVPATQAIHLNVVLAPSHPAQLQSLLSDLYDPRSPRYHQWLDQGQFLSAFGPSPSALAAVRAWLAGRGLVAGNVSGFAVPVTAAAGAIATALGVPLERYRTSSGSVGFLTSRAPLVPLALGGGQISGILGLNTVAQFHPVSDPTATAPGPDDSSGLRPEDGHTACPAALAKTGNGAYTLDALGTAYGISSLLAAGQNGHGETIGLFELGSHSAPDVAAYMSCMGLDNPVSTVAVDGGGGPLALDSTGEADLDIEQAATQAPEASIISYEGPNGTANGSFDTWQAIVSADVANVVSTSFGECETAAHAAGFIPSFTTLFEQAATQGQTVLAADGDSGAEDCYVRNNNTSEQVDYPASDAWVTAVGGTSRPDSGVETTWNFCQSGESIPCADDNGGEGAGGGGMSRYEPRPIYQPNVLGWPSAQPCGLNCREVPDISTNAGVPMVFYTDGAWDVGFGTSFDSPLLAGLVADRNDGCTALTGVFTPALYALYDLGAYGTAFTDVTSGDNDLTGSNGGSFAAGTGYDPATGIGTPLAAGLSCPEVTSLTAGSAGQPVTISGLGLEHAAFTFGGVPAQVIAATATQATVVVPAGSGTVVVQGSSVMGTGTGTSSFSYGPALGSTHGYWLVGSDGGIFTFGSAPFFGSTGSLVLQRPVVGITPTADRGGYWLVAADGGTFSFGDAGFYGSIPGLGLAPAGTADAGRRLNAPVVGLVPSSDGGGYFMVAADGGVFAFGDAKFEGSCPSIGGCSGTAVAIVPDGSGNGYWLVTSNGAVYPFGDAPSLGSPGSGAAAVTSAVATPDGKGYWILFANGAVAQYGDAPKLGDATGTAGGANPATAIFATADGGGFWIATINGSVYNYGDAPNDGGMAGERLNGGIIAASGW
jgi:subtilase family serine protease